MQTNKRICFFIDGSFFAWSTLYTDYKIYEFNMSINLFTNAHYKDFEMVFFILFIKGAIHQWYSLTLPNTMGISPFPGRIKGGCIWSRRNPSSYNSNGKSSLSKKCFKKTNFQTLALHECKELLTFNINTYINTYINT